MIVQYEREFKRLTQQMADVHRQIAVFQSDAGFEKKKVRRVVNPDISANRSIRRTKTSPIPAQTRADRSPNKTTVDFSDRRGPHSKFSISKPYNWNSGITAQTTHSSRDATDHLLRTPGYLSGSLGLNGHNSASATWSRSKDGHSKVSQKLGTYKPKSDERTTSHKQSLLGQTHSEANLLPVKLNIKSQRAKRIRGWKKTHSPATLGVGSGPGATDNMPQATSKGLNNRDTPRDRSTLSKSIIQTTPEDEDKKLVRVSYSRIDDISSVRRSQLDDRESPRPCPAPSRAADPESLYQNLLKQQIAIWSQELSLNLQNELQRRYVGYEETIAQLQSEIVSDQASLDQLQSEESETQLLVPRIANLTSKVRTDPAQTQDYRDTDDSESITAQIHALKQEIISLEGQNGMLRGEIFRASSQNQDLHEIRRDATSLELSSAKKNWQESDKLLQELRDAEERLSRAAAELETAEGQRKVLYQELSHYQTELKVQGRPTVSSRLEHSIPLEPSAKMVESRLAELLDNHNIALALATRDVQTAHGYFDELQEDWQQRLEPYSVLWQPTSDFPLDPDSEERLAAELRRLVADQTETVLDLLISDHEERSLRYAQTLQEIRDLLSCCVTAPDADRPTRRSASESKLFGSGSDQKQVTEFDPKT